MPPLEANLELNTFHSKKVTQNTKKLPELLMSQLKEDNNTVIKSNTKLNTFQMYIPTDLLTIPQSKNLIPNTYHKKDFNKELNIKLNKDKSSMPHKKNK